MEIHLSVSAVKPKTYTMSAADTEAVAQELLPKLQRLAKGGVSAAELETHAAELVSKWVKSAKTRDFSPEARSKSASRIAAKMLAAFKKRAGASKKAPASAPADKVVPTTKAATKEEKLKAQILAGTKLRNQFQGMLTKAPALTSKSIENIRKHCDAYLKVINVVQKGKTDLAETAKIEGLRGIESVKNYVSGIRGLTYGYVELAKYLGNTQTILGEKISDGINIETMTKVAQKQRAKENAQRNLSYAVKALSKRGCALPAAFLREVEKVFVDGAQSGDYKTAKARLRELITGLVNDVFTNKVKLFQSK